MNQMILRLVATAIVWGAVIAVTALVGVFLSPTMGDEAMGALFFVTIAALLTNGFIWQWGQIEGKSKQHNRQASEDDIFDLAHSLNRKRKRDEIGGRLSDLSDDQLLDLRERLQVGAVDDDELAYLLRR